MAEASNEFCFIYSTYPDLDTARAAARLAIDQKLAACVNIYPKMTSFYMWQGKMEESAEYGAFFKTRRTLWIARLRRCGRCIHTSCRALWCCRWKGAAAIISPGSGNKQNSPQPFEISRQIRQGGVPRASPVLQSLARARHLTQGCDPVRRDRKDSAASQPQSGSFSPPPNRQARS